MLHDNLIQSFFFILQECGFKPSIISYGCLINLYVKVSLPLVCSHVFQSDYHTKHALFFLLSLSFLCQCIKDFKVASLY